MITQSEILDLLVSFCRKLEPTCSIARQGFSLTAVPEGVRCTSLIATQAPYIGLDTAWIQAAIAANPMGISSSSTAYGTGLANCHNYASSLKEYLDKKRLHQFFSDGGPPIPLAVGVITSRLHVVNIFFSESGSEKQIYLCDYFTYATNQLLAVKRIDLNSLESNTNRAEAIRFINQGQSTNFEIQTILL